ncbi:MAG: polymer-forming cytoskeletal protein [Thermoanaerobacteraceae bacterium]|nr:polymer-forming cytoskeletal protein [Thermoanaerobacteraceae bacterium]
MTNDDMLATSSQIPGLIVISGIFNGDIRNGIDVYVTSSGCFKGNIMTKNLVIAGKVTGDVQVENLKICASGRLYFGKIHYDDLNIEEGGLLIKNRITTTLQKLYPSELNSNIAIIDESEKQEIMTSNESVHFNSSF